MSGIAASDRSTPQKLPVNHFDPNLVRDWRPRMNTPFLRCYCAACGRRGRGLFMRVPGCRDRFRLHHASADLEWFGQQLAWWHRERILHAVRFPMLEPRRRLPAAWVDRFAHLALRKLHPADRLTADEWLGFQAWGRQVMSDTVTD